MIDTQTIAIWASNALLNYADHAGVPPLELPRFAEANKLGAFLVDNYELLHLYPDEAVWDEIERWIEEVNE